MPKASKLIALLSCFLFSIAHVYAGGLSSYLVEAKMENLKPWRAYSLKETTGKSLTIVNTTEGVTVDIAIEPEKPVDYNLVKGYEPIPDLSWIKIKKNYFKKVGPKQSIETDIIIKIPPSKKYYGKRYQVYIYSHTAGPGTFRIGLMSRILFSTAPSPSDKNRR